MSVFGDKSVLAIESEISRILSGKKYAHLRLWAAGKSIGDYEEEVVLLSCISHLTEFLKFTGNRYESDLNNKSKEEVFQLIFESVVVTLPSGLKNLSEIISFYNSKEKIESPYENIISRFHVDSFGMSALDGFNIILVETGSGSQRFIWRANSDMKLHEVFLQDNEFESVANQFLLWAESQISC